MTARIPTPIQGQPGGEGGGGDSPQDPPTSEQVKLRNVGARVPAHVNKGVFSTGAIVMTGPTEFVIDFVQRMGRPHHIIARVIVPHGVMGKYIQALEQNIQKYTNQFGAPKDLPKPPPAQQQPRQSIQDVYDDLKLPDEMLSGVYANGVLIGHSAAEFSFDFVTNFYPHSAVSCRVFMASSHVPQMLDLIQEQLQAAAGPGDPGPAAGAAAAGERSQRDAASGTAGG